MRLLLNGDKRRTGEGGCKKERAALQKAPRRFLVLFFFPLLLCNINIRVGYPWKVGATWFVMCGRRTNDGSIACAPVSFFFPSSCLRNVIDTSPVQNRSSYYY